MHSLKKEFVPSFVASVVVAFFGDTMRHTLSDKQERSIESRSDIGDGARCWWLLDCPTLKGFWTLLGQVGTTITGLDNSPSPGECSQTAMTAVHAHREVWREPPSTPTPPSPPRNTHPRTSRLTTGTTGSPRLHRHTTGPPAPHRLTGLHHPTATPPAPPAPDPPTGNHRWGTSQATQSAHRQALSFHCQAGATITGF